MRCSKMHMRPPPPLLAEARLGLEEGQRARVPWGRGGISPTPQACLVRFADARARTQDTARRRAVGGWRRRLPAASAFLQCQLSTHGRTRTRQSAMCPCRENKRAPHAVHDWKLMVPCPRHAYACPPPTPHSLERPSPSCALSRRVHVCIANHCSFENSRSKPLAFSFPMVVRTPAYEWPG